jgi:hypothetical protein
MGCVAGWPGRADHNDTLNLDIRLGRRPYAITYGKSRFRRVESGRPRDVTRACGNGERRGGVQTAGGGGWVGGGEDDCAGRGVGCDVAVGLGVGLKDMAFGEGK